MATFFQCRYHEDPGPAGIPSEKDLQFLTELAKELRTQGHYGNAAPRYFGLTENKEIPTDEEHMDGICLFDRTEGTTYHDTKEDMEFLIHLLKDEIENLDENLSLSFTEQKGNFRVSLMEHGQIQDCLTVRNPYAFMETLEAFTEYCTDHLYLDPEDGRFCKNLQLQYYRNEQILVKDALFLTQKGAQDYLAKYGYNHKPDCHSYCMTAVRSPEYETLLRIVEQIDWDALKTLCKTAEKTPAVPADAIANIAERHADRLMEACEKEPLSHFQAYNEFIDAFAEYRNLKTT